MSVATLGSGSPVLYLHGAPGLRVGPAIEGLAEHHRLVMPAIPGSDGTPPHAGLDGAGPLADLCAALAERAGAPCRVVGQGFGGWAAAWTAVLHPQSVDLLVLDAPCRRGAGAAAEAPGPGGPLLEPDLYDRAGDIGALTLILAGTEDDPEAADAWRVLHRGIADAHLCFVHGAGRDIQADRPRQWTRVVDDFLADRDAFVVNRARR